ncbi:MAG: DUF1611 domain-containing protein [Gammaproteobacteria bacterium]
MQISSISGDTDSRTRQGIEILPVEPQRLASAKRSYTTRRVDLGIARKLLLAGISPKAGDLVLARVVRIGQHSGLQLPGGRRATLFVGDEIVVTYGNRYAPDQFEARVPDHLGPCHLVAAGGIAAEARSWHSRMKRPTEIEPVGVLADDAGQPLNLFGFRLADDNVSPARHPCVIAVVGTSMNAGKTTAAAHLIRGLVLRGLRVGAAKVTGTGAIGDVALMADAGAQCVVDFTDFGFASTYRVASPDVERVLRQAVVHAGHSADAVVVEIADGLYQEETAALLKSATFRRVVTGVVFAAADSMGAAAGIEWLEQRGLPVLAVSGALTASPLGIDEASRATRLPVLGPAELADPEQIRVLIDDLRSRSLLAAAAS